MRGGSGLVRGFRLRAGSATVSLLAERHVVRPMGAHGGGSGALGTHTLTRRDGSVQRLPAKTTIDLAPGDAIVMRTAGGGGYGDPDERDPAAIARDRRDGISSAS
jgi:N-methylhydantoinase B